MDNKQILETLQIQPLSEEEKTRRHILGRLYGPIATGKENTRNERHYSGELWKKALSDEVFREKIANKSLFLELGHPADREETDMEKVCACIPEMPKIVNGDLYAYVDILDTPNGKILKTLIDYGFVPGISSRGSGDVDMDNEVDPETFYLETWDIVQLPALKRARMAVCESFQANKKELKNVLVESLNNANEEDRKIMQESLVNLNIIPPKKSLKAQLKESLTADQFKELIEYANMLGIYTNGDLVAYKNKNNIISDDDLYNKLKAEATEITNESLVEDLVEAVDEDDEWEITISPTFASKKEEVFVEESLKEDLEDDIENEDEDVFEDEIEAEVEAEEPVDEIDDPEEFGPKELISTDELKNLLDVCNEGTNIVFTPISIDGIDYEISAVDVNTTEDTCSIAIKCTPAEEAEEIEAEDTSVDAEEVTETETDDEAIDNGSDELVESVKELTRINMKQAEDLKNLKEAMAVNDVEVKRLTEESEKYKNAFVSLGNYANKIKKENEASNNKTAKLEESLANVSAENKKLKEQLKKAQELKESMNNSKSEVNSLQEKLNHTLDEAKANEAKLTAKCESYKKKADANLNAAKAYRDKLNTVVEHYIKSKADALGVKPTEITNRLNEHYTLDDIDSVCEGLLESTVNRLPFNTAKSVKFNTAKSNNNTRYNSDGYDIDDDLLELAGLKKSTF